MPVKVKLHRDDFLNIQSDACICPIHRSKDLKTFMISKHLLEKSGNSIQAELSKTPGEMSQGEVHMTEPGQLSYFKNIMFICLRSYMTGNELSLQQSLHECFQTADAMGLTSITIPALGTGGLKYPPLKVASATIDAIALHNVQFGDNSKLTTVNIALFTEDVELIKTYLRVCMAGTVNLETEDSFPNLATAHASSAADMDTGNSPPGAPPSREGGSGKRASASTGHNQGSSSSSNTSGGGNTNRRNKNGNSAVGLTTLFNTVLKSVTNSFTYGPFCFTVAPSIGPKQVGVGLHMGVDISFLKTFVPPGLVEFFRKLGGQL